MKQWVTLLLAVVLLLTLCACGNSEAIAEKPAELRDEHTDEPAKLPTDESAELPAEEPETEPEEQNTRSVRHLPNGNAAVISDMESGFYSAVQQGNTIFLANDNKIGRMPVGGGLDDVEIIGPEFSSYDMIREMQVVGDWIYLRIHDVFYIEKIWRLRTDGTDLQEITDGLAADDRNRNTFAVIGDLVYFPFTTRERLSASEDKYTTTLYCYNPNTGWSEMLYQVTSDSSKKNLIISSYNENSLLLLDFSEVDKLDDDPTLLIYEYGADAPFVAPDAMQDMMLAAKEEYYYCVFYDDMTNTGSYLAVIDEVLYRMTPDNGYIPEELPVSLFTAEEKASTKYEDDIILYELLVLDAETYIYSYWYDCKYWGIRVYQNGTITDINGDKGTHFDYLGDGYLYYSCVDNGFWRHHRVHLDGTQWEQLYWEVLPQGNAY